MRDQWKNQEYRENQLQNNPMFSVTEESRESARNRMKRQWQDDEFRKLQEDKNPVIRGEMTGEKNGMYRKGYLVKGENNGMYGKSHEQSTRSKMSESRKGRIWINNGVENKCVHPEDLVNYPEYSLGRVSKKKL